MASPMKDKAKKCVVEPGHEVHYGVKLEHRDPNGLCHCACKGCGKHWTEYGDRFRRAVKKVLPTIMLMTLPTLGYAGDKVNIFVGQSLDLSTTEVALNHGLYEGNPLMRDGNVRVGYKVVSTVLAVTLCHELRKRNPQSGAAKWLSRGILIFGASLAVNNVIQMRRTH